MKFFSLIIVTFLGISSLKAEDLPRINLSDVEKNDYWSPPLSLKNIPEADGWTHLKHKDLKIAVLVGEDLGDSGTYIPISAYIYNELFQEWRRFMTVETRGVFSFRAKIDHESETLQIIAAESSPLNGTMISSFSLKAVGNDLSAADP
jgi:hypothetical protein